MRDTFPLVALLTASVVLAQAWAPFAGTWKLDMAKSQFSPAPAMRSATVTFKDGQEVDGGIRVDGLPFRWSHAIPAGGSLYLSPASRTPLYRPNSSVLRTTHGGFVQGLGFFGPVDVHGIQTWGHDGVDAGAGTAFFYNRKLGVGAIAFANANNPDLDFTYSVVDIDLHLIAWFEQSK